MFKTFALVASLVFCATMAHAGSGNKVSKVEDCKYWTTKMVMSTSSGSTGHVISGKLDENGYCQYNVRLSLDGQLVMVNEMRDYELMRAPARNAAEVAPDCPAVSAEDRVEGLDFGN
jgi:hypothetical protein